MEDHSRQRLPTPQSPYFSPMSTTLPTPEPREKSFAETALELGGKSADEALRTGAIDKADDQVEQLFKPEYQTINSPIHRAVWDGAVPLDLFEAAPLATPADVQPVMEASLAAVMRFSGTVRNAGFVAESYQKRSGGRARRLRCFESR